MTRTKAEKIRRGIEDKISCNTVDMEEWAEFWGFSEDEYDEFLDMTVQALEQQPVLDKIRAEIEQIEINGYIRDVECFRAGIDAALNVINKHKVENEW